jgi:3'-phosphoadenosine 5'-phosphosulfate sulfotransferase (PAPS reductase)/FAD synthetase
MTSGPKPHTASALLQRYAGVAAIDLLEAMIHDEFPGRIALSSSFGADSAVLLHMVSRIDSATPVLFLETGKLFGETIRHRMELPSSSGSRMCAICVRHRATFRPTTRTVFYGAMRRMPAAISERWSR